MKKTMIVGCIAGCMALGILAAREAHAGVRDFTVDSVHSSVTFSIRHLYNELTGRFNRFHGTATMDPEDLSTLKFKAEVDVSSIDTAVERRDDHLRNPDFFEVEEFPKAYLESTAVTLDEDGKSGTVTARLTIRDQTHEITFKLDFGGYGPDHRDGHRSGFRLTSVIPRSQFGVDYNTTLPHGITVLGENVTLTLGIQLIETDDRNE